jgi:hypothetical protein
MSHFEYIMVMVSIIQGLGLTLALRGISRLIRSPNREIAVVVWAVFLVFLYLQNWWAFWDMASVENWNFFQFLLISLFVCVMYAMTELMLPMAASPETDWPAHFLSVRKWFFGMTVVLVFLGVTLNVYISGVPLLHPYRVMQFTILFLAIAGWITPRLAAQRWIATVVLVVLFSGQILFRLLPGLSGI